MITFVVNLHTGIPGLALAEPFLYPLQKMESVHLLFSTADNIAARIEDAAMKVRQHLERAAYLKWQVVFMVKIAPDQRGPFQDSLSAQMTLIRSLFLESSSLNLRPTNCFVLAIDHVNEDEAIPAVQTSENYRDSWELDTTGYIRTPGRFFVSEQQLLALDSAWKQYVNVDKNTIVNLGFNRLPAETQNKVMQAIESIMMQMGDMLNPKKIDFKRFAIANGVSYLNEKILERISSSFAGRLEGIKQDPSRYNDFLPSEAMKTCLNDALGVFSEENQNTFKLLRYPLTYSHEDILQQHLVKIAVLITLLTQEEDVVRSLSRKNYTVNVEVNNDALGQVMTTYMENLHNTERRFTDRLANPLPIKLELLENNNCTCNETLDRSAPPQLLLGFLRTQGDLGKWEDWNKNLETQVVDYSIHAQRKIQNCVGQSHKQMQEPKTIEVADIDATVQDLTRQRTTLQTEVQHQFFTKSFTYDWGSFRREQEANFKPLLFSRPTKRELIYMLLITGVLLTIAFVNVELKPLDGGTQAVYYLAVLILAVMLGGLAFWLAKRDYQKQLNDILLGVYEKARSLRSTIYDDFERQKTYLASLCQLNMVRHNYDKALAARDLRNEANVMLDFHRRKLSEHKDIARNLLRIFRTQSTQTSSSGIVANLPEPDVTKPIYENDLYAPNTFMVGKASSGSDVVRIENTPATITNSIQRILNNITFDRDKIYTRTGR